MQEERWDEGRNFPRINDVSVGGDGQVIDRFADASVAVITGAGGQSHAGSDGIAYAGGGGIAKVKRYGLAICGPGAGGSAEGGAGCVVFAYDGGNAVGGDGSVVVARRGGNAATGTYGVARAFDGNATTQRPATVAIAMRQNKGGVLAQVASGGVAIVRDYVPSAQSAPAHASAAAGAIAIAFEQNLVSGDRGALLVGTYKAKDGTVRFATAVVDGNMIRPGQRYRVDAHGQFVAAN